MQAIKRQGSLERESSKEKDKPPPAKEKEKPPSTIKDKEQNKKDSETTNNVVKRIRVKEVKAAVEEPTNDVQYVIQVKHYIIHILFGFIINSYFCNKLPATLKLFGRDEKHN